MKELQLVDNSGRSMREVVADLNQDLKKHDRWERELAAQCRAAGFTVKSQVKNLIPGRKFVFDLLVFPREGSYWEAPEYSVLVEVRVVSMQRDCEKVNLAQLAGYVCLLVAPDHVKSGQALNWIEEAI